MIIKILLSSSVQTPNSDKNWQTSCPLQTFVCNISRHLEFIIDGVAGSTGSPGRWIPGSLGRWATKCDPVPCLQFTSPSQAGDQSDRHGVSVGSAATAATRRTAACGEREQRRTTGSRHWWIAFDWNRRRRFDRSPDWCRPAGTNGRHPP